MIASRKYALSNKYASKNRETVNTFLLSQDSTVLQMLLELCQEERVADKNELLEIRNKICGFIHQRFIENQALAKLVHFQTYDPRLLPVTVNGIDSIHVCMYFLPELMAQAQLDKQVFGVQLASYLCEKYPMQRCIELARIALQKVRAIVATGSESKEIKDAVSACIAPIARFAVSLPFLAPDCTQLLQEIRTTFNNDSSLCEQAKNAFAFFVSKRIN